VHCLWVTLQRFQFPDYTMSDIKMTVELERIEKEVVKNIKVKLSL
jgi:hypothetical protein